MGTMLISGTGAPCPAPGQCLEIDLSVEAEQVPSASALTCPYLSRCLRAPAQPPDTWQVHRQTHVYSGPGGQPPQSRWTGLALCFLDTRAHWELAQC